MSILFLDTEFNGLHGELISMALVSDDRDFYQVMALDGIDLDPWVDRHVKPYLFKVPHVLRSTLVIDNLDHFARELNEFLSNFDDPQIIADWPADFEHFSNLLTIIGANGGFKEAYVCTMHLINVPGQLNPEVPHNALSDARALRDWYLALNGETGTQTDNSGTENSLSAKSEEA